MDAIRSCIHEQFVKSLPIEEGGIDMSNLMKFMMVIIAFGFLLSLNSGALADKQPKPERGRIALVNSKAN